MKNTVKLLNNQKGFSLTEIMIGGGILAGVALASAQLFKDQKMAQKKIEFDQKLAIYHNNLSKFINKPENCNSTMKTLFTNGSSITARRVPTLYRCTSGCQDDNSTGDRSFDAYTSGKYQGAAYISEGSYIDNTRSWRIREMNLIDPRNTSGPVRIRVTYDMVENKIGKPVNKDIFVQTRFDNATNTFKECVGGQESNINNLQSDLCKSLNLNEVNSNGQIAHWDDAKQTCVIDGTHNCPAGQQPQLGSDGNYKCKPIVNGGDAADLQSTDVAGCTNPQMYFVNGKVRLQCP